MRGSFVSAPLKIFPPLPMVGFFSGGLVRFEWAVGFDVAPVAASAAGDDTTRTRFIVRNKASTPIPIPMPSAHACQRLICWGRR